MKIEGIQKCNSPFGECEHEYVWMYQISQSTNGRLDVEMLDKPLASVIEEQEDRYKMRVICPKCNQYNTFEYIKN
ncbi:hypothetical protein [Paenibacillus amylolyticus]|uniref:hypothetical protein n=1 Tax=Paenibacillus amylolyticus TaxID=1451 RepID=UPI003D952D85